MPQYFYAYHGPKNGSPFDPSGGYGVASRSKRDRVMIGDWVFVIQKTGNSSPFELCGPFEVAGHYNSDSGKARFRLRLVEPAATSAPITLNEESVSQQLPRLERFQNWSNFKRHFCRQGASLQEPLSPEVVDILSELVGNSGTMQRHAPTTVQELEKAFQEDVEKSRNLTSEERQHRLAKAKKVPATKKVFVKAFVRNPDVVAETLHMANGRCGDCGEIGPFERRSDGSRYLEVHHKLPLAQGGEDSLENAIALCPNCHRKRHYGVVKGSER